MAERVVDHYGKEIVPGAGVAFNFSGEVRLGVVVELGEVRVPATRWHTPRNIKVYHLDNPLKITRITSDKNLVVL